MRQGSATIESTAPGGACCKPILDKGLALSCFAVSTEIRSANIKSDGRQNKGVGSKADNRVRQALCSHTHQDENYDALDPTLVKSPARKQSFSWIKKN